MEVKCKCGTMFSISACLMDVDHWCLDCRATYGDYIALTVPFDPDEEVSPN